MSIIHLHNKAFKPYLSEALILEKVKALAENLNQDYADRKPLFIAILNGSFMFASDLFKQVTIEAEICFIKLASYKGTKSTGQVVTAIGLDIDITNRHIIVLEDIIDTGKTLIRINPKFYRPAEVNLLIGDPSKAKAKLGWVSKTTLGELCRLMVDADLRRNQAGFSF